MKFIPLGEGETVGFGEALSRGLAPDRSLYFPENIPTLSEGQVEGISDLTQKEVGRMMLSPWVEDEICSDDVGRIVDGAVTFETPVVDVGSKKVLELFHGPTMAFKDVAARYLAELMGHYNLERGLKSTVLVATSGDTGGAIAHGFADVEGTSVVVLYPKGKVSSMQQEQLRRTASNVHTIEVDGVFDDCQDMVKDAMQDPRTSKLNPTSANSISVGRLFPQTTYYADAIRQIHQVDEGHRRDYRFVVPTGNLGNLTAGIIAQRMGIPISSFLAANNENDLLTRYLYTGVAEPRITVETMSNAMDVGNPNNFPRFTKLFDESVVEANKSVRATRINDKYTTAIIRHVYDTYGYLLDTHTAVAWAASNRCPSMLYEQDVIVATAAPEKFADEIYKATGIEIDNTGVLATLRAQYPEEYTELPASSDALIGWLLTNKSVLS